MGPMAGRAQIVIKGIVQGVGFRPFVYNLAASLNIKGYVTNTSEGVFIDAEGEQLSVFVQKLREEAPPLSHITGFSALPLPLQGYSDFSIRQSLDQKDSLPFTLVSPDVSVCEDCLHEMLDPQDRRHLYPFINCTNCGPRYSITTSVPYDRPNTTMSVFPMCPDCMREYQEPRDRRFHAQPNACPVCGPRVEFRMQDSKQGIQGGNAIPAAIKLLREGGTIAIKGIGGFHIACDATNDNAVRRLRERKRKNNKPFAVMAPSVESAQRFCGISDAEKGLLLSIRRPIVLLQKKNGLSLSDAVAPNNQFIGVMLPYAPLHDLLFRHPVHSGEPVEKPHFHALVMTSGNLSEEPIVRDNDEALQKLSGFVDGFLFHNRDIFMRVDDSVLRITDCAFPGSVSSSDSRPSGFGERKGDTVSNSRSIISFIRRSRGYAPDPIFLHEDGPEVLGCGADLKTTFTLTKGVFAIPSQHIGDMENYETFRFYEETLKNLKAVYRAEPLVFVHDLHPGYGTTRWAINEAERTGLKTFGIQHHYAHVGSVMAEHGLKNKIMGVALDGTGYGTDGNLWGGEFLIADIEGFERVGQFRYMPLPGGESAIREPWRTAVSLVIQAAQHDAADCLHRIGFFRKYGDTTVQNIMRIAQSQELSPLSSGAGRLFEAVAALTGVCDKNTFEGEAAIALESFTRKGIEEEYEVAFKDEKSYSVIDFSPAILSIIKDLADGQKKESIATKFHNTVASVIRRMVKKVARASGLDTVALTGGTFQNRYLLERTVRLLAPGDINVFINQQVPTNDACISLGQAYLIRERIKRNNNL